MSGELRKAQSLTLLWMVRVSNAAVFDVLTLTDGDRRVTKERWRSPTDGDGADNRRRLACETMKEFVC
jgi:hypothetical protein